eukprot:TRINITY_DN293_c0_g1_i3.p1 TRINITY_DN293_c0_g1~~TRINITY_DN293_c0_g1_i3.p1  ORF type:complete len:325 (+),score=68.40 TRINITY_DN293_c0_g1_i3:52-1026(+)
MGERKVLNKYYPPDLDPAKVPKAKRLRDNEMRVRMMLPMSIRCTSCGEFMYKGTKFNMTKEDVTGETYLGLYVFRFYMKCAHCNSTISFKTDPRNSDYAVESGATRNYEPWKEQEEIAKELQRKKEVEEEGNAMKALENRTLDSKKEMDIMASLDEMKSHNVKMNRVTTEQIFEALKSRAEKDGIDEEFDEEEEKQIKNIIAQRAGQVFRIQDDPEEEEAGSSSAFTKPKTKFVLQDPKTEAKKESALKPKFIIKKQRVEQQQQQIQQQQNDSNEEGGDDEGGGGEGGDDEGGGDDKQVEVQGDVQAISSLAQYSSSSSKSSEQ